MIVNLFAEGIFFYFDILVPSKLPWQEGVRIFFFGGGGVGWGGGGEGDENSEKNQSR